MEGHQTCLRRDSELYQPIPEENSWYLLAGYGENRRSEEKSQPGADADAGKASEKKMDVAGPYPQEEQI